jgi:hypothetical protein
MIKIYVVLFGFIFTLAVFCSCEKGKELAKEPDSFSISYLKGSSWTDYSYHAIIDQNGLLQITEISGLTKLNRESTYHLDDSDLTLIKVQLDSVVKIDILDQYGFDNVNAPTDLPVTKLVYITKGKSDSTSIYFPKENEIPLQFDTFMQTIEKIILEKDTFKNNN